MKKRDNTFYIVLLIKSILMGTVNKLPGVSGGLVALLTGFYIEMINSLRKINLKIIPLIFKLNFSKINKNYNGLFLFIIPCLSKSPNNLTLPNIQLTYLLA